MARCSLGWRRSRHDWVEEIMLVFDLSRSTDEFPRSTGIIDPESVQVGNMPGSLTSQRDSLLSSLAVVVQITLQAHHDHVLRF